MNESFGNNITTVVKSLGEILAENSLLSFIFALVIGLPSMVLYAVEVMIVILYSKQFNSAFFTLFLVRALLNLINYFTTYMYARFGRVGLFKDLFMTFSPLQVAFWFFMNFYNYHCENLITCFISVNRLTSIIFPMKHKMIWKYLLPISILATFGMPLPFLVHSFIWSRLAYVRIQADNRTFTLAYSREDGVTYVSDSWLAAVSAILFLAVCGLLNIATIVAYRWSKRKYATVRKTTEVTKNAHAIEEEKIETRLHIYAFVTFLGQLLMCTFLIMIYETAMIFDPLDNRFVLFFATLNQLPWVSDFSTIVVPAWLILWASTLLRQILMDSMRQTFEQPFKYIWRNIAGLESASVSHGTTTSLMRRMNK
ncbi:srg family chemoreceptor domain-containing protein [Ditylenchus destructor]|nr:srg family chemoreceptor domain-containing protein [Ditylenchus destructor]